MLQAMSQANTCIYYRRRYALRPQNSWRPYIVIFLFPRQLSGKFLLISDSKVSSLW